MKTAAAIALVLLGAGCATTQTATRPRPVVPPATLLFRESLPPETRVCVLLDPFRGGLACAPLEDVRVWLRSRRLVRFGADE